MRATQQALDQAVVGGEGVLLSEGDPPLVPIELPDHLAVADLLAVERIERAEVHLGGDASGERIEVPVDGIAEVEGAVPQQVEAAVAAAIDHLHHFGLRARAGLAQQRRRAGFERAGEEPIAVAGGRQQLEGIDRLLDVGGAALEARAARIAERALDPLARFLRAAIGDLPHARLQQPFEVHAASPR